MTIFTIRNEQSNSIDNFTIRKWAKPFHWQFYNKEWAKPFHWQFYNKEWAKPFHENFTIRSERSHSVTIFTIRSEWSHFLMSCLLCLGIFNKEWAKPFHDELLVMFGNSQLGVSEAIPWWVACYVWDFTIRSEWSHSMTIYNKEWGKPFHDELLVMFGNLQLGVSEPIPWWVACYVWDFTIRSEWSHSMTIYNKGVREAIPWWVACYVWVRPMHVCKIPETAYLCSDYSPSSW
jgi:hypothetical protein